MSASAGTGTAAGAGCCPVGQEFGTGSLRAAVFHLAVPPRPYPFARPAPPTPGTAGRDGTAPAKGVAGTITGSNVGKLILESTFSAAAEVSSASESGARSRTTAF